MQAATATVSLPRIAQESSTSRARTLPMLVLLVLPTLSLTAQANEPAASSNCATGKSECVLNARPRVVIDADEWKNAGAPRGLMVLIQSNLDRVSAVQDVWPAPRGVVPDARLQIVDAYADFLRGDFKGMDASIAKAEQATVVFRSDWEFPLQHASSWRIGKTGYYKRFAASTHKLMVFMQSSLRRSQAGQPVWPTPKGAAPAIRPSFASSVYAESLISFFQNMDSTVRAIGDPPAAAASRLVKHAYDWKGGDAGFYKSFTAAAQDPSPLVRLFAALRDVDGSLFSGLGNPFTRTADGMRGTPSPLDGTWMRLPCRTVIGRVPQFVAATDVLTSLGGPVLDCPTDGPIDYAKDETLALHPEQLIPHVVPSPIVRKAVVTSSATPPRSPGSREAALSEMDTHPQDAAPILERYSHVDARGELDYALFLHSFEPKTSARNATVHALQRNLYKKAMGSPGYVSDFPLTPYDGTDNSLLNIIRQASETGMTNSSYYAIPCAFLIKRPALIAATQPYYGSNRDNFMPRSGCADSNFMRMGFPVKAVTEFETASTQADGNFIDSFSGTMVYGLEAGQNSVNTSMRIDPRSFLNPSSPPFGYPSPSLDYPYQVWGYTSLNNHVVSLHIRKLYRAAHNQLTKYYLSHMQLSRTDSEQAAKAALFLATFGGNCGGTVPAKSLRKMLLEHASQGDIAKQLGDRGGADATEVVACSKYAGLDPLLLVAVDDPAAFPLVIKEAPDINESNAIGKTALMEAAQFDQTRIVDLLLAHHAAVNATTGGSQDASTPGLGNDARTALMYAAAYGSLDLIKTVLNAGADTHQADTKGYRAIDYLLGYGPTSPNPHLSERERKQASQWLF